MNEIPISALLLTLLVLLLLSAFFSVSETSMMAINRYRMRHLAKQGHKGAGRTAELLANTDKLLGVILLGNNLINAASATLVTIISIRLFGNSEWVLGAATIAVTFAILVFSEITPKVIGAAYPDKIAYPVSFILRPLLSLAYPIVWFVNLFVQALLRLMRLRPNASNEENILGIGELRTLVMESGKLLPATHRSVLLNLLELENITVNDVMTPRHLIEAIAINESSEVITRQLTSSRHTRLPIYRDQLNEIIGIVHLRALARDLRNDDINAQTITAHAQAPYFIPSGTLLFTQLRQFQENQLSLGLVVDEYGELLGLVSLGDILEEMVGELDNSAHARFSGYIPQADGSWLIEGTSTIRQINRRLKFDLPDHGPKTINGLILEHLEAIPEAGTTLKIAEYPIEIIQVQERLVKTARIFPRLNPP
ncbi:MAG: HlyC/CorC family transporter [Burkholderiales bacterium]